MNNLAYLLIAVGASIVGSLFLWWRHRRPRTFMSSIDEFQREMDALSGDPEPGRRGARRARPQAIVPAPETGDLARKLKEARRYRADDGRER